MLRAAQRALDHWWRHEPQHVFAGLVCRLFDEADRLAERGGEIGGPLARRAQRRTGQRCGHTMRLIMAA
jgi:hypothetical protein